MNAPLPKMTPVVSSNIVAIGHDEHGLVVTFKNGSYRYATADSALHDAMLKAESPGKFFREFVAGKHESVKL